MASTDDEALLGALANARALGFLGPGPVAHHVDHARAFLTLWRATGAGRALDLGSGGGVPGLVLAVALPQWEWVLVDVNRRRTSFLVRVVAELGLADRVTVVRGDAIASAHEDAFRSSFDVVTARSFGPPGATAEVGGAFLRIGGDLLVAEPPEAGGDERWPAGELRALGLVVANRRVNPGIVAITRVSAVPEAVPRPQALRQPLF